MITWNMGKEGETQDHVGEECSNPVTEVQYQKVAHFSHFK